LFLTSAKLHQIADNTKQTVLFFNPNPPFDRLGLVLSPPSCFPTASVPLPASCPPPCLGVARYAFAAIAVQAAGQLARFAGAVLPLFGVHFSRK
jgi:hypothetical protein